MTCIMIAPTAGKLEKNNEEIFAYEYPELRVYKKKRRNECKRFAHV